MRNVVTVQELHSITNIQKNSLDLSQGKSISLIKIKKISPAGFLHYQNVKQS